MKTIVKPEFSVRELIVLKSLLKSDFDKSKVMKQLYLTQEELDICVKNLSDKICI